MPILPVSLLHHSVSSSFGLKARLPFILEQLSRRTEIFRDELSKTRGRSNLILPLNSPLQTKLNALEEAGSHDPLRIASTYEAISTEILIFIGLHKDLVTKLRQAGSNNAEEPVEERQLRISLCRIHMLATSMRLLAASADTAGAENSISSKNALRVSRSLNLASLIKSSSDEVRAFCVEKFGAAPGVDISSIGLSSSMSVVGVKELLSFAYVELLKNAMTAMISRYTAAGVDDAPEIKVQIACDDPHYLYITLTDSAGGLKNHEQQQQLYSNRPFRLFSSVAAAARQEIDYKYSREFGVPFSGSGLGLLRSDLFCKIHGGYISLYPSLSSSNQLAGTSARIVIARSGSTTDLEALESII